MSFPGLGNHSAVVKFYKNVMDDVLSGVREAFLDEGVDEQVLQELRQMWETKVSATGAIDPPEIVEPQLPPIQVTEPLLPKLVTTPAKTTNGVPPNLVPNSKPKPTSAVASSSNGVTSFSTLNAASTNIVKPLNPQLPIPTQPLAAASLDPNRLVPIQLSLPAMPGSQDQTNRVYNIQVPASALGHGQLQRILTSQIIQAAMSLPVNIASTLLQQHITASIIPNQSNNFHPNSTNTGNVQMNGNQGIMLTDNISNRQFQHVNQIPGNISQIDGVSETFDDETVPSESSIASTSQLGEKLASAITRMEMKPRRLCLSVKLINEKLAQVDGIHDSDDEDDDDDIGNDIEEEDDDDDEIDDKEEENEDAENGVEDDPLNSGDDVSEGDNTDLFETENVVVCQYDKVNRSRNKWKFYLKDGIMNLSGRDYIFQKASGDAEW